MRDISYDKMMKSFVNESNVRVQEKKEEKHPTWRCLGSEGTWCEAADKPAVRAALCDGDEQSPVFLAGEKPLISVLPIRAASHVKVLKR